MRFAALPLLLIACVTEAPDDEWSDPGKADDPSAGGIVATHSADVRVLDGFHALLDTTSGRCLEPADAKPAYSIGAIEKPFELRFVSEKEDLANTLGVDIGLKIKYGTASGSAAASFLDNFKQTRSATHLLVTARASYRVTNVRPVKLTGEASDLLASDPRAFLHRCGNFYVNGVEHEAQLFVMIRLDALTEDAARTITGELGLSGGTAALGLDGTVKSKLEHLAKRDDIGVEMHVLDRGFLTDGGATALISSLLASGLSAATFEKIDGVRKAMLESLNADACRDGGMGLASCPADRPGYEANAVRNAVPVRLDLRSYARATNAPVGGPGSPYEVMRGLVDRANRHMRGLARHLSRMEAITSSEIGVFLDASLARKALYGIAPPAPPVFRIDALVATATRFRDRFDPDRAGSEAAALQTQIATCWAAAQEGALDTCATPDLVGSSPEARAADAAIADYLASGRIVPLRFTSKGVHRFADADAACAADNKRLPSFAEAERLAPAIGFAELARSDEARLRFAAWHADRSKCGSEFPTFSNVPTGSAGSLCTPDSFLSPHRATTLCVPAAGVFDPLPAP
jgi:hypothetical protein